jgi:DNA-3-methyladenine glycosylase
MNKQFIAAPTLPSFLDEEPDSVARKLLGCIIERTIDGIVFRLRIVETESYDETDAASHSYKGRTPRTDVMFGPSGRLYVYFTYGMHYCCNIVSGKEGVGQAALIRALEPLNNLPALEERRGKHGVDVTNGPAKLCSALGIDRSDNGHDLRTGPIQLLAGERVPDDNVVVTTRIGISKNKTALRRFYIKNSPYVSKRATE